MSKICFIDTNILMYAVGSPHPLKTPCLQIVRNIIEDKIMAVTDTEVFQEIAYRYWCQKKWHIAVEVLRDYQSLFTEILPIEKQHLEIYYQLLSEYPVLSPRDAIHLAVMKLEKIRTIYTADRDFKKIDFIEVVGP